MSGCHKQVTRFVLEGRFLEAFGKSPAKPKYLRISTAEGEQVLKISKKLRPLIIQYQLEQGSWITLSGKETYHLKKGKRKRKIQSIQPHHPTTTSLEPSSQLTTTISPSASITETKPTANPNKKNKKAKQEKPDKILICQKSSCCKRGGKEVYQAAVNTIDNYNLHDRVQVKPSGCMDKCKKGPCVVMQADKTRHLGVQPEQVEQLIKDKYPIPAST